MTREEIMNLDLEGLEERAAQIAEETREASEEALAALTDELDAIEERKKAIEDEAEEKRAAMAAVIDGQGTVIEAKKEERKMDSKEIRNSKEYIDAYVEYIKGNTDGEELRALLTENVETGTIAVPTYIEDRIRTAWENDEIMSRVNRTYFKGNLKVGYEASASGAVVHTEGGAAIAEEDLQLAYIELIPQTIKKLVRVSDEVMDVKGQAFLDYLYDEIEYQIVKRAAAVLVGKMIASTLKATYTVGAQAAVTDIISAAALLSGEAVNPVVITTRATEAAYKVLALNANYAVDVFDGMEVVHVDQAALGDAKFIVADLSGAQANFPNGGEVKFKFDDLTEAAADMVRILGRLPIGMDVVAPGRVVVAAQ